MVGFYVSYSYRNFLLEILPPSPIELFKAALKFFAVILIFYSFFSFENFHLIISDVCNKRNLLGLGLEKYL